MIAVDLSNYRRPLHPVQAAKYSLVVSVVEMVQRLLASLSLSLKIIKHAYPSSLKARVLAQDHTKLI